VKVTMTIMSHSDSHTHWYW